MDDLPPSFATQAPSIFDSRLPKLTAEDIEKLKSELPELTQNITMPDVSAITQFFFVKSLSKEDKSDIRGVEEKLVQAVSDAGLASNLDRGLLKPTDSEPFLSAHAGLPHLKDLDKLVLVLCIYIIMLFINAPFCVCSRLKFSLQLIQFLIIDKLILIVLLFSFGVTLTFKLILIVALNVYF